MLQDIERGLRTEVDVINGSVVSRARELGRKAPHNQRVVELVHEFERGALAPSATLFADVMAAGAAHTAP
jgi:2-dehydropantoate 2-reductase